MTGKWAVPGLALLVGAALAGMPAPAAAELKVRISGYVKLDLQWSDTVIVGTSGVGSASPGVAVTPLDFSRNPGKSGGRFVRNHEFIVDARQTRLRVSFSDDVMGVKISGRVETDFADLLAPNSALVSNSRFLRLRHAFARGDHPSGFFLLAGQTWSLFMNSEVAQPDLVNFKGPAGRLFARQPQLRVGYKAPLGGGMGDLLLEVDLEKHSVNNPPLGAPPTTVVNHAQGQGQDIPLFAGKISWFHSIFQVEAGGAVANNRVITAPTGIAAEETAWAGQVSAQANVGPFSLYGHYHHQEGLGRLTDGVFNSTAGLVARSPKDFELRNIESHGFYVGGQYRLTKDTSFNAVYGWHEADRIPIARFTGGVAAGAGTSCAPALSPCLARHQSVDVNVLQKFWERWQLGLEYRHLWVDAFNRAAGNTNVIQGAIWFFF